jgi:hypothetical protein
LESPDKKVSLVRREDPKVEGKTLNDYFNQWMKYRLDDGTVDYSFVKDNWFVICRVNSLGYEFYAKFYLFPPTIPGEESIGTILCLLPIRTPHERALIPSSRKLCTILIQIYPEPKTNRIAGGGSWRD